MASPLLVEDLRQLPPGSHCLSFHHSEEEAARHAVEFLSGAPDAASSRYWVADERLRSYYDHWLQTESPGHLGRIGVLLEEQVSEDPEGRLRPVAEVRRFVETHPAGVSAGADTLSRYWSEANVPAHLEYESWFDRQPRAASRFLCPYDLRRVPLDEAATILGQLAQVHSHVVLSRSREPGARLLQLFVYGTREALPERLDPEVGWALRKDLARFVDPGGALELTSTGDRVVQDWSARAIIDW
ncbi:MAG TPA: hypothetical protein VEY07_02535 [Thermoplasmata archaeon]|nr:hypothetical protein [Thermoplasmata archaeon]